MKYTSLATIVWLAAELCTAASPPMVPYSAQWGVQLKGLPPDQVFSKLDLNRPGLEPVKAAVDQGDQRQALGELLRYYRGKYPPQAPQGKSSQRFPQADRICRHVFQWGPYEAVDYGAEVDWARDPVNDIEWVAAMYRFYWAGDLTRAYLATRDDKYARAFVELTTDWIAKHPLEHWTRVHPTLPHWKGFAWLDLQTGIRANAAANAFKAMVHSEAVTPEFLGVLLASLYDHQVKTECIPMGRVHNKAIFEQRGVLSVCHAFPEFGDTPRWAKLALDRASENLLAQTTEQGVQREWCGGYHLAVLNDGIDMMAKAADLGLDVPDQLRQRVQGMCDYLFAVATPDLAWPMFGDTSRSKPTPVNPLDAQLSAPLLSFSERWKDPKYAALVKGEASALPSQTSYAFESAGVYVMRSKWGPQGTYLALHCAPPPLSQHDQPDNGTFELYAYGRWLLTDSGYYTYGHDKAARAWHRRTQVHQTLTLDGKDSATDGRLRLWHLSPELDALVVENPSYAGLVHRRSVWFVDKQFYVFLDEAIGQAPGEVRVHWTPAPGPGRTSPDRTSFTTQFPDVNVLIQTAGPKQMQLEAADGWFAWDYGQRTPRTTLSVKHPDAAPAAFLTIVAPYRGTAPPEIEASLLDGFEVGGDEARVSVRAAGKQWQIGRSLNKRAAWCTPVAASAVAASQPGLVSGDTSKGAIRNGNGASSPSTRPAAELGAVGFDRLAVVGSSNREDEFPAVGADVAGNTWICWVGFDGKSDALLAARLDGRTASSPIVLSEAPGDHWRPAMGRDGQGRLWVTWAQSEQGKWDIYGRFLAAGSAPAAGGEWSEATRLTHGEGNDFAQKLAVDQRGTLWMAWQSVTDANYEILLAPITPEGPGKPLNISRHPASDWEPALAAGRDGRIWVAWDSYRAGSYDIMLAELKDNQLSEPIGIATSPAYEAHATLAVDHQDRLWIAWDNGGPCWGQDNQEGRKLHNERSVEIRCLAGGEMLEPAAPLSAALQGSLASFCELPDLNIDGDGRLWLTVRHLTDLTPEHEPGKHVQTRGVWNPYVLCYDGDRWSQAKPLPDSSGRNDMRVCTCVDSDGRVWVAWADDGRKPTHPDEPQHHSVHAAQLVPPGSSQSELATRAAGQARAIAAASEQPWSRPARYKLAAGGQQYLLLYGDTHRHTDLSRCGMNVDGSLMDTYRYAIDVAELDFLAISDHDQDLLKHRYQREKSLLYLYSWWRSEKYCDLFSIENRFVPLYAYEHGGSFAQRGGHKNVLYAERGESCHEEHSPEALFRALTGKDAVVIPHQLADGPSATDWSKWNSEFERVAEVFQARGSYEFKNARPPVAVKRDGHYLWDALSAGVRIGIIASSDHGMVHNAYAGVYSRQLSRAGVMEGLRSRRTFGSMDRMVIDFRLGDRLQGEEVEIHGPPALSVRIQAPKTLRTIQIVKNGAMIHTVHPDTLVGRLEFVDLELQPGQEAWYYVRCEQVDDQYGWSSPIWVKRSPESDR